MEPLLKWSLIWFNLWIQALYGLQVNKNTYLCET